MIIPPLALLRQGRILQRQQDSTREHAMQLAGPAQIKYVITYEALQMDLEGEIERLLGAIGAPARSAASLHETSLLTRQLLLLAGEVVKSSSEDMAVALQNYDEVESLFQPLGCLHEMLAASEPKVFEDCQPTDAELRLLEEAEKTQLDELIQNGMQCIPGEQG